MICVASKLRPMVWPLVGLLIACSGDSDKREPIDVSLPPLDPYPSTYTPRPGKTTLIDNVTILTGTGARIDGGAILLEDGRISAIGKSGEVEAPDNSDVIDGEGRWVTPGVVDAHSHLGVYPSPSVDSTSDGNEWTSPVTPQVWAEHAIWPQDPGFTRALAGGVTAMQILPGSANLFGGRTVTVKNVPSRSVQGMKFPNAPHGLKMACGENPKRVYGQKGQAPATRMGNFAGYRQAWIDAMAYKKSWDDYIAKAEKGEEAEPPKRDLKMDTLMGVLNGDVLVHMHCYRADEMMLVLDMAKEFGYDVTAFHHAVESYKIADVLAEASVCSAVWADWWGFKLEAYDGVRENAALIEAAGACAVMHSDSPVGIQRLNQEAAKALAAGRAMGLEITRADAVAWFTANPAKSMGIFDETGSLEKGKAADVVLWSRDPFSVYAKADMVFIDGALMYDRADPATSPRSDFELGHFNFSPFGGAGQ